MEINIGEALKERRESSGRSLAQLAKETGISHQNLSRWEANKVIPNALFCLKLAEFYGITIDELLGRN